MSHQKSGQLQRTSGTRTTISRLNRSGRNPSESAALADKIVEIGRHGPLPRPATLRTRDVARSTQGSEVPEFGISLTGLQKNPVPLTRISDNVSRAEIGELGADYVAAGGDSEDALKGVGHRPQAGRS